MNLVKNFSLKNKILIVVLPIIIMSHSIVAYATYLEVGNYVVRDMVSATEETSNSLGKWLNEGTVQMEQDISFLADKPGDTKTQPDLLPGLFIFWNRL